jgi:hypothetical protein
MRTELWFTIENSWRKERLNFIGVTWNIFIICCSRMNVCNLLMKNVQCRRHNSQGKKIIVIYMCECIKCRWDLNDWKCEDEDFRREMFMNHPFILEWRVSHVFSWFLFFIFLSSFITNHVIHSLSSSSTNMK